MEQKEMELESLFAINDELMKINNSIVELTEKVLEEIRKRQ